MTYLFLCSQRPSLLMVSRAISLALSLGTPLTLAA
ncbi:MAG: hypothetical protein MGAcid_20200 [uncultured Acidilobus sp. MG]|nr:MAG: hypothetical protein MGAcid_20200 [uncultured Acidilobus sp. MG]